MTENTTQSLTEEVQGLFEQAGLEAETSAKLSSLFEASVTAKVNQIKEQIVSEMDAIKAEMQEQKELEINEAVEEAKETLAEQVGAYLDYFADEFMEKNKIAIENGIRVEVAENFINKMLGVFKENYVDLPEEKYDLVASLQEQVAALEKDLNEQVEQNDEMKQTLIEQSMRAVFVSVADGLTDTEVEKLAGLVEGIDYENDDVYRDKLTMIKETYIGRSDTRKSFDLDFVDENTIDEEIVVDKTVNTLVESLDRLNRR